MEGAELVGLIPELVLAAVPPSRWAELGLSEGSTVESRLADQRDSQRAAGVKAS